MGTPEITGAVGIEGTRAVIMVPREPTGLQGVPGTMETAEATAAQAGWATEVAEATEIRMPDEATLTAAEVYQIREVRRTPEGHPVKELPPVGAIQPAKGRPPTMERRRAGMQAMLLE
jgi:hypothetical protein